MLRKKKHLISLALIILAPLLVLATNGFLSAANASFVERINVAAAANGGVVIASSTYTPSQGGWWDVDPGGAINGDRTGKVGTKMTVWLDSTQNAWPDWLQVDFSGSQTIDEIDVFTIQDAYLNPIEPTETTTFSSYGVTAFEVQYWNLSTLGWVTVTGGNVTGNNKVWNKITFAPIVTTRIRVLTQGSPDGYSRLAEVEAWGPNAPPPPSPTPTPPPPEYNLTAGLAQHDIYIDADKHVGFGTPYPIFNDDGVTGAYVGKWVAIDGKFTGAAAYLGVGGNVTNLTDRVGQLAFYNIAMGGVDHRTAFIGSGNDGVLGRGYLDFATAPHNVGPQVRMRIASDGSVRIGHPFISGGALGVTALPGQSSVQMWFNSGGIALASVLSNGKLYLHTAGAPIILKAPNGQCFEKSVDNAGNWVTVPVTPCPQ